MAFGHFAVGMNSNLYHMRQWKVPKEYVGLSDVEFVSGKVLEKVPALCSTVANRSKCDCLRVCRA